MAMPERDTVYNADGSRKNIYARDSNTSTGWVIGGIIVVALVVIAYFVFAGHSTAPTGVDVNATTPAVTQTAPAVPGPVANPSTTPAPMTAAPAPTTDATTPATPAPTAPATATPAPAAPAPPASNPKLHTSL